MSIDSYTFGNSEAAVNLVAILEETGSKKYTAKVSKFLNRINKLLNDMIRSDSYRSLETKNLVISFLIKRVKECDMVLPEKIKSHMQNVAMAHIRKCAREPV